MRNKDGERFERSQEEMNTAATRIRELAPRIDVPALHRAIEDAKVARDRAQYRALRAELREWNSAWKTLRDGLAETYRVLTTRWGAALGRHNVVAYLDELLTGTVDDQKHPGYGTVIAGWDPARGNFGPFAYARMSSRLMNRVRDERRRLNREEEISGEVISIDQLEYDIDHGLTPEIGEFTRSDRDELVRNIIATALVELTETQRTVFTRIVLAEAENPVDRRAPEDVQKQQRAAVQTRSQLGEELGLSAQQVTDVVKAAKRIIARALVDEGITR